MKEEIEALRGEVESLKGRVGAIEKAIAWVTGGAAGMTAMVLAIKTGLLKWLAGAG